ncbi:transglutaminase family protein [Aquihabitans daechungensis]|uniref:transglutaminase family protein n=1 Tax=Aquihabitans daechungensis TaxID=1052257 RepID=UPI003B9E4A3C
MSHREQFDRLVRSPIVPLGESCFVIAAQLGHPEPVADGLAALEALTDDTAVALAAAGVAHPDLDAISHHLFTTLGFAGDADVYYDVRNSMLPDVLRRRIGIPISLGIVLIEVAQRLDVTATGVGMPGHFLVGEGAAPGRWVDAFDRGRWLDAKGAEARFRAIHGADATFDPAFLAPTPRPQVLARVLANLAGVYRGLGDPTRLLRSLELRCDIPGVGQAPRAQVELAEAYVTVGRVDAAISVLEALTERVEPRRREVLVSRIDLLRASLN